MTVTKPPDGALCVSASECHAPSATFGPSVRVASVSVALAVTSAVATPPPPPAAAVVASTRAELLPSHAESVTDETRGDCAASVVAAHHVTLKGAPASAGGSAGAPPAAAVERSRYAPAASASAAPGRPARSAAYAGAPPPAVSAPPSGAPASHAKLYTLSTGPTGAPDDERHAPAPPRAPPAVKVPAGHEAQPPAPSSYWPAPQGRPSAASGSAARSAAVRAAAAIP